MALLGKSILTTQAAAQSGELSAGLRKLGARVVECPTIELEPVENWTAIDDAIARMSSYQWLMFTSANAVDYFMKRVASGNVGHEIDRIPIAVVGSTTATKLEEWKLKPALIPKQFNAEGLLEAFPSQMQGVRVLFPRAETAREILPEELQKRGAVVDVLPVYRTKKVAQDIRQIFARELFDCVVFTSPSAIRFMAENLEEELCSILSAIPIAVIGPVTARACEPFGLRATIEPKTATIPDLVEAIHCHFVKL